MSGNKIDDLRVHLFATLDALRDKDNPMDLDRAKTIAEVAGQVIHSAKVEVDFMRVTGSKGSGFIPEALPAPNDVDPSKPAAAQPRLIRGRDMRDR